jgi:hypothetical protein
MVVIVVLVVVMVVHVVVGYLPARPRLRLSMES